MLYLPWPNVFWKAGFLLVCLCFSPFELIRMRLHYGNAFSCLWFFSLLPFFWRIIHYIAAIGWWLLLVLSLATSFYNINAVLLVVLLVVFCFIDTKCWKFFFYASFGSIALHCVYNSFFNKHFFLMLSSCSSPKWHRFLVHSHTQKSISHTLGWGPLGFHYGKQTFHDFNAIKYTTTPTKYHSLAPGIFMFAIAKHLAAR